MKNYINMIYDFETEQFVIFRNGIYLCSFTDFRMAFREYKRLLEEEKLESRNQQGFNQDGFIILNEFYDFDSMEGSGFTFDSMY